MRKDKDKRSSPKEEKNTDSMPGPKFGWVGRGRASLRPLSTVPLQSEPEKSGDPGPWPIDHGGQDVDCSEQSY